MSQRTRVALRPFTEKDFESTAALFAAVMSDVNLIDGTCDVSFYEHKRMSRMVTRAFSQVPSDGPDTNGLNMYVYAQELG